MNSEHFDSLSKAKDFIESIEYKREYFSQTLTIIWTDEFLVVRTFPSDGGFLFSRTPRQVDLFRELSDTVYQQPDGGFVSRTYRYLHAFACEKSGYELHANASSLPGLKGAM